MYVKIVDGAVDTFPYSVGMLRTENPNTSFPYDMDDEFLEQFGVYRVVVPPPPNVENLYLSAQSKEEPELIDGVWTLGWETFEVTQEAIDMETETLNEQMRHFRNAKLLESDWTQVSDSALSSEAQTAWRTYRTALRNLPDHENWPRLADDDWPTKPEV
tara:strand:- start:2586 stop:3062 length:477 start_codon:yes stop_codon:yes gene_type:complete